MSGLIQRLLDRASVAAPSTTVVPAGRSSSPLAVADQRLQDPAFRNLGTPMPDVATGEEVADPFQLAAPPAPQAMPRAQFEAPEPAAAPNSLTPEPRQLLDPTPTPPKRADAVPIVDPIAALRAEARNEGTAPISLVAPGETSGSPQTDAFLPPIPDTILPLAKVSPIAPEQIALDTSPIPISPRTATEAFSDPDPAHVAPDSARAAPEVPMPIVPKSPSETVAPQSALPGAQPEPEPSQRLAPVIAPSISAATAVPPDNPEMAPEPPQQTVERIVERVLSAQPSPASTSQDKRKRRQAPPTAESVSLIGALPQRRSSHTLFGLRRG